MTTVDLTRQPLIDGFSRPITYLRVSVTDKCNLRCVYCMPETGLAWLQRDEILSYEEIAELVRAAASVGVRSIRLTGGEPLVRRDLHRLVAALHAIDGIDDISLSTNALLLANQVEGLAAAGLRRVNVSLDSLRHDRFEAIARRPGLDAVMAGIDAAICAGLEPIKLNCVVMRGQNDDEIAAFAELTRRRPIFVRFIEMMPVHENLGLQHDAYMSSDEILARVGEIGQLRPVDGPGGNGPARYFAFDGALGAVGVISPALARVLRPVQSRPADRRRPPAALPLRRPRAGPADAASVGRLARGPRRSDALGDADQARTPPPAPGRDRLPHARLLGNRGLGSWPPVTAAGLEALAT